MTTAMTRSRRAGSESARVQTTIVFLAAVLLALAVIGTLAGRAHASISCAAKSVAVASNQCDGAAQVGGRSAPAANVTFVFER